MALEVPYRSIPDMFLQRVAGDPEQSGASPCRTPTTPAITWLTWAQVGERAKAIAAGLAGLGVGLEDRVAILSSTRLEWVLVDLGINCAGAATTTVYPTTEPEDAAYIVADSGSKVLVAENPQAGAEAGRRRHRGHPRGAHRRPRRRRRPAAPAHPGRAGGARPRGAGRRPPT